MYDDMMYHVSSDITAYPLDEEFVYVVDELYPWLSDVHYRDELDDVLHEMSE